MDKADDYISLIIAIIAVIYSFATVLKSIYSAKKPMITCFFCTASPNIYQYKFLVRAQKVDVLSAYAREIAGKGPLVLVK